MNGPGSWFPGPGGAGGPGGRPGANVDGGGVGPAGTSPPRRPPGGAVGGGGAPLGNRVPLGSGHRNSGSPALRQKFSGSRPRFLNAASTNGCMIWPGARLCKTVLKNGPDAIESFSDGRNLPTWTNPAA